MRELVLRDYENGEVVRLGLRALRTSRAGSGTADASVGCFSDSGETSSGIGAEVVAGIETFVPADRIWQIELDEEVLKGADREALAALEVLRARNAVAGDGGDRGNEKGGPSNAPDLPNTTCAPNAPTGLTASERSPQVRAAYGYWPARRPVRAYPQVELRMNGRVVRTVIAREIREDVGGSGSTRFSPSEPAAAASSYASSASAPLSGERFVWVLTPVDRLGAPVAAMAYELGAVELEIRYLTESGPWTREAETHEALADVDASVSREAVFRAEPFFLCVPKRDEGYVLKLSDLVFERAGRWFVPEGKSGRRDSATSFARRIALLERLLVTFEECAHYLRANARFRLVPQSRVDAVEKLRAVTSETVRYVAEHPDELVLSPSGAGLRIGGRTYLPRHVLVESSAKRFDTYENRAILGVLASLGEELRADAREAADRADKLQVREPDRPGYVSTASPLAKDAAKRLLGYAEALCGLERRTSVLFRDYRTMLPAEPIALKLSNGKDALRPTEVFRSIPAYRAIFEAISGVQRSEKPVLESEAALITAFGRSRLFELHALFRVLEGLSAAGFRLTASRTVTEPELERAGRAEVPDRPNRFFFEKITGECVAEVLVCYEPVVRLSESASEGLKEGAAEGVEPAEASGTQRPEEGEKAARKEGTEARDAEERFAVRLARTTVLSPAEGGGLKVVAPEEAFFTPDFVVRVSVRQGAGEEQSAMAECAAGVAEAEEAEEGGRAGSSKPTLKSFPSRWFVADAKYSTRTKTVLERTMDTAYKYLLAMSPTRPGDTLEGVWLFYAWEEARGAFSGNSLRTYLPAGLPRTGDVHYECAGLGDGDSSFVRAVIAACEEMAQEAVSD